MKKLTIALIIGCQVACACALETQQPALIYEAIEQHIANELSNNPRALTDVKSTIGPIDNRIRLQACEAPLNIITEFGNANQKQLTVKVTCEAPVRWTLRVPVKLQIFQSVVVASQQIPRDQVITGKELQVHKQDINQLTEGYFQSEEELIGLSVVKSIQPGAVIKRHMVRQPLIIHRGETVKIVISAPGFNLEADGVAQADGAVGDTIRIKNTRSNKMIDAKVKGSGVVSI